MAQGRYSDEELQLIKSTYAGNLDLLKAIRKHLIQLPKSALDSAALTTNFAGKPQAVALLRKIVMPEIMGDEELNQIVDLMMTVTVKDLSAEHAALNYISRDKVINYFDQQFKTIDKQGLKARPRLKLEELANLKDKSKEDIYVDMLARNMIISHVEFSLGIIQGLAGEKDETLEQQRDRIFKNSAK